MPIQRIKVAQLQKGDVIVSVTGRRATVTRIAPDAAFGINARRISETSNADGKRGLYTLFTYNNVTVDRPVSLDQESASDIRAATNLLQSVDPWGLNPKVFLDIADKVDQGMSLDQILGRAKA